MITFNGAYYGKSTDSKPTRENPVPTEPQNGFVYIEMNTGKIYFYDAATDTWLEWGGA